MKRSDLKTVMKKNIQTVQVNLTQTQPIARCHSVSASPAVESSDCSCVTSAVGAPQDAAKPFQLRTAKLCPRTSVHLIPGSDSRAGKK